MKEIPNRQTKIARPTSAHGLATFADLISDALDFTPPGSGFTPSIMRARARVDEALKNLQHPPSFAGHDGPPSPAVIVLEDADYATAKEAMAAAQWRIRSPDLLELFGFFGL